MITNEKQNKSVKDLVNNIFWEESPETKKIAEWFRYTNACYHLAGNENNESEPQVSDRATHVPSIEDCVKHPFD